MSKLFGQKLKRAQLDNNLTLEQLGDELGTSKNYVWQLENKEDAYPSAKLLLDIADLFELKPRYLIDDDVGIDNSVSSRLIKYWD